ncbi:helix-turn-helix transcriptional regulator [Micromonospora sp. NPDC049836]|uniref:helix-turn-helix transcriptional regulator n=1 Tax=Micromonospora sp. NPDC049836 TaxID=3364274 RepID=UPI00379E8A67
MTLPEPGQHAVGRRAEVLRLLRDAGSPMAIAEIAERLGIHVNTARFHLQSLVSDGRVERTTTDSRSPGRPPQLFQAIRRMDPTGPRHFRVLAEVLAEVIATDPDPSRRVLAAGRLWGRHQAATVIHPTATKEAPEPADSVERLMRLLDELGFAPERPAAGDRPQINLRHCPFFELAVSRTDVVCPVHLGLMQGAMQSWASPITVDRLDPFVQPDRCVAHLSAVGGS